MVGAAKARCLFATTLLGVAVLLSGCHPDPPQKLSEPPPDLSDQAIVSLFGPEIPKIFLEYYPQSKMKVGQKKLFKLSDNGNAQLEVGFTRRKGTPGKPFVYLHVKPVHPAQPDPNGEHLHEIWMTDRNGNKKIDRIVANYRSQDEKVGTQVIYYESFMNARPGVLAGKSFSPSVDFFHTTDFEYIQPIDQWKSNYSGSKWFSMFFYDETAGALRATNESPFCFFDKTGNGFSNVVLRVANDVEWAGKRYSTFRYSFDADGDATSKTPYDTDFSISGFGRPDRGRSNAKPFAFGKAQTLPVIAWQDCEQAVLGGNWDGLSLTWIEDDRNAGGEVSLQDPSPYRSKRWEGVINLGSDTFPQVGGPPVLDLNSRTETKSTAGSEMVLYESSLDQKLHLKGARSAVTSIDVFGKGRRDFSIQTIDENADGYFDKAVYQIGGTHYSVAQAQNRDFFDLKNGSYAQLVTSYRALLASQIEGLCQVADKMKWKFPRHPALPHCNHPHFARLGDERKRFELFGRLLLAMESLRTAGKLSSTTVQTFLENHRSDFQIQ